MSHQIINTRADLDALAGTPAHTAFIAALKGSLTRTVDQAIYPEDYDRKLTPKDKGYVAPSIVAVPDDSVASRFGFTKNEIEQQLGTAAAAGIN